MTYVKIGQTTEFTVGSKKKISLQGKDILIANILGSFYAVDNTCPHMGGSLADGRLEGSEVACPKHGSVFDLKTGHLVDLKIPFEEILEKIREIYRLEV